jgi:hypothetical protein
VPHDQVARKLCKVAGAVALALFLELGDPRRCARSWTCVCPMDAPQQITPTRRLEHLSDLLCYSGALPRDCTRCRRACTEYPSNLPLACSVLTSKGSCTNGPESRCPLAP